MRKFTVIVALSLITAVAITFGIPAKPYADELLQLHTEHTLPHLVETLQDEPVEIQAVFFNYAHDTPLLLKTQLALLIYPEMTREILPLYAAEPEFQEVLLRYGESVIPPIHYFLNNEIATLDLSHYLGQQMAALRSTTAALTSKEEASPGDPTAPSPPQALDPEARGWYAVNYIKEEGHDFLGQFVLDQTGEVEWLIAERAIKGTLALVSSGVRTFGNKVQLGEAVTVADGAWALSEVVPFLVAGKVITVGRTTLRAGQSSLKAARVTKTSRTVHVTLPASTRLSKISQRLAKLDPRLGAGFLLLRYPRLLNGLFKTLANAWGLAQWLVQLMAWFFLLLPGFFTLLALLRRLIDPLIAVLKLIGKALGWVYRKKMQTSPSAGAAELLQQA